MGTFDLGKFLKNSVDQVKGAAQETQKAVQNIDLQAIASDAACRAKDMVNQLGKTVSGATRHISTGDDHRPAAADTVTAAGAVKLMYLIMSADGRIADEELARLDEIGPQLDEQYETYREILLAECAARTANADPDEYLVELRDYARDTLALSLHVKGATIPVKLLLWDMLVIALSDNEYAPAEDALIRYIAKHMGIDKSIVSEMVSAIKALTAVENEMDWIKSVQRPYRIVEAQLNALSDRKHAIMQGVHMLISD